MQGFAFKVKIATIALFSAVLSNSLVFAADTDRDSSNRIAMSNAGAGCMGCHQGETITSDEVTEKSADKLSLKDKKKDTSQQISENEALPG